MSSLAFLFSLRIENSEIKLGLSLETDEKFYLTPRKITDYISGLEGPGFESRYRQEIFVISKTRLGKGLDDMYRGSVLVAKAAGA
jgi:hypothetical protein